MDFDELAAKKLSPEEALAQILHLEKELDSLVAEGKITEEESWDAYFGLLHECDERNFLKERRRIITKIDTKRYDPFKSKNPGVHIIARLRVARAKIPSALDN